MELTIKLKVKGVDLELSMQEARELAGALKALMEPPVVVPYAEPWWWRDWRPWGPIWTGTSDGTVAEKWSTPDGSVTIYGAS